MSFDNKSTRLMKHYCLQHQQALSYRAYELIYKCLEHTIELHSQKLQDKRMQRMHISASELLLGVSDYLVKNFAEMSLFNLQCLGLDNNEAIGKAVFDMIEAKVLAKNENDNIHDFSKAEDIKKLIRQDQIKYGKYFFDEA